MGPGMVLTGECPFPNRSAWKCAFAVRRQLIPSQQAYCQIVILLLTVE